jgi:hypothetical protein
MRHLSLCLLLLVVALGGCGGRVVHQDRYTGSLPGCGLAAATLTRAGDQFAFAPGDGVLTIRGTIAPDGSIAGTLNTQPPDKPAFLLSLHGTIGAASATLDYATPRCHARGTLVRASPGLL